MRVILVVLLLFISDSFGQVIKGTVLDEKNQPLLGANIYFDGTTIATISDENGNFSLNYGSKPNSILAISFIGFQTQFLTRFDNEKDLIIKLKIAENSLNEVVVKKDRFSRKQKMQLFREQFLGITPLGKKAKIENEESIYFDYDENAKILKAYSENPLVIRNDALGYKINFELVSFEANFYTISMSSNDVSRALYTGFSRFEEIDSDKKTIKLREKSFQGSQLHFFRSLAKNEWSKDGFLLFSGSFQTNPSDHFKISTQDDVTKVIVTKDVKKGLSSINYVAMFNVLFNNKQQSKIIFDTATFYIDKYGNNSNIENILFSGYMSGQKAGEMLPINYGIE